MPTCSSCLSTCSTRSTICWFFDDWFDYLWIGNSQLCLSNVAHEHFITQTGKKSKAVLKNFMGPWVRGVEGRHMRPSAESQRKQISQKAATFFFGKQTMLFLLYNFDLYFPKITSEWQISLKLLVRALRSNHFHNF